MTREQWNDPGYRNDYYQQQRASRIKKRKEGVPPRLGVFADPPVTTFRDIRPRGYCNFERLHTE